MHRGGVGRSAQSDQQGPRQIQNASQSLQSTYRRSARAERAALRDANGPSTAQLGGARGRAGTVSAGGSGGWKRNCPLLIMWFARPSPPSCNGFTIGQIGGIRAQAQVTAAPMAYMPSALMVAPRRSMSKKRKNLSTRDRFRFDHFAHGQNSSRGSRELL
jgi:hypothetical protein